MCERLPLSTQQSAIPTENNLKEPLQLSAQQCSPGLHATVPEPVADHGSGRVSGTLASPLTESDERLGLSAQPLEIGPINVENDPAKWPVAVPDTYQTQCIEKGPQYFRNRSEPFPTSERQYTSQKRYLSSQLFVTKAANG